MQKAKIIVIASAGITTNLLVERLSARVNVSRVFLETAESKKTILKRRLKRLGIFKTIGQIMFMVLALPFIGDRKKRITAILEAHKLNGKPIDEKLITHINSVHDAGLTQLIIQEKPQLIFINGTRILKKTLLDQLTCPIVNIHVGITPKYRGVHGGYWAIRNNDLAHFGVTLHLVDSGIDTGQIIAQQVIQPKKEDNFKTYPVLQYCVGLDLINENLDHLLMDEVKTVDAMTSESHLYYHPSFWGYLFGKK